MLGSSDRENLTKERRQVNFNECRSSCVDVLNASHRFFDESRNPGLERVLFVVVCGHIVANSSGPSSAVAVFFTSCFRRPHSQPSETGMGRLAMLNSIRVEGKEKDKHIHDKEGEQKHE